MKYLSGQNREEKKEMYAIRGKFEVKLELVYLRIIILGLNREVKQTERGGAILCSDISHSLSPSPPLPLPSLVPSLLFINYDRTNTAKQ